MIWSICKPHQSWILYALLLTEVRLGLYGVFVIERNGTDVDDALASLQRWKENIFPIPQLIQNDVSSTKIRMFLRREMSIQYLIPAPVVEYIEQNHLYEEDDSSSNKGRAKGQASGRDSPAVASSSTTK
jgi:nicotinamide mononucleotide adenylyltransferase